MAASFLLFLRNTHIIKGQLGGDYFALYRFTFNYYTGSRNRSFVIIR